VSGLAARPAVAGAPGLAAPPELAGAQATVLRTTLLRLVAFAALALFGAAHWARLVQSPPGGRVLLIVLVATGTGAVLALLGTLRARLPGALIAVAAVAVSLAGIGLGLAAAGLEVRLLWPGNWDELFDGLDRGLAGVQGVEWPYSGSDAWIRLTILLGAPLLLGVAAALAFFPVRGGSSVLRAAGLGVLLTVYVVAVSEDDPGAPLLRGVALLLLVAAWLWLPRLGNRDALAGAGLVLSVGVLSLPIAAALDSDRPWWDYEAWTFFGNGKAITFDWAHRYGPLDWPREGTTLLNVRSDRAHYWKAETLDAFDGLRWTRGRLADSTQTRTDLPDPTNRDARWDYFEWNPRWDERIRFTVRSLSTNLLVAAGSTYDVTGALAAGSPNGTAQVAERLEEGDSYTISTYAPNPTPEQMRGAPDGLPSTFSEYTLITLPPPGASALEPASRLGGEEVVVPLWDDTDYGDPSAPREAIADSVYGDMHDIVTRVTGAAPTMYDAVRNVERYLNRNYTYSEKPRRADIPLNAFLFRDRFGYCQQFSGAMALMLRMAGIPARVAAGFAPGSLNRDTGEYRVRDLDAHSWVEVYFNGIGWVSFDPTPAAAPAQTQAAGLNVSSAGGAINGTRRGLAAPDRADSSSAAAAPDTDSGTPPWLLLLLPVLVLGAVGLIALYLVRRTKRLSSEQLADAQLAELRRALGRLGWEVPAGTTLLGLERRLGRIAGPSAARYAAGLRAHRYDPRAPAAPTLRDRRQLRRDLTARGGLRGHVLGLLAIPPGGPRPV
jgi:transglutaminase-like putative cysteine protease